VDSDLKWLAMLALFLFGPFSGGLTWLVLGAWIYVEYFAPATPPSPPPSASVQKPRPAPPAPSKPKGRPSDSKATPARAVENRRAPAAATAQESVRQRCKGCQREAPPLTRYCSSECESSHRARVEKALQKSRLESMRRMCTNKRWHKTVASAEQHIAELRRKDGKGKKARPARWYQCPHCDHYHVTSH
jgi:hypothetical protein